MSVRCSLTLAFFLVLCRVAGCASQLSSLQSELVEKRRSVDDLSARVRQLERKLSSVKEDAAEEVSGNTRESCTKPEPKPASEA